MTGTESALSQSGKGGLISPYFTHSRIGNASMSSTLWEAANDHLKAAYFIALGLLGVEDEDLLSYLPVLSLTI